MSEDLDTRTISAMQVGEPIATYKKVILAKLHVYVLNSFTGEVEGLILSGQDGDDKAMVDVWSTKEDAFFKAKNKNHFASGAIIPYTRVKETGPKPIEQFSDEELREVVNTPSLAFRKTLAELKSEAVVNRILTIAREEEKSEKTINSIMAKLSELQGSK